MDLVLTPEEAAEILRIEPGLVVALCEEGYLSGFRHGDSWRIARIALVADLERLQRQLLPAPPVQLAPRGETPFRRPPVAAGRWPVRTPDQAGFPEQFIVRIEVNNDSDYSGDFAVYLSAENPDGPWELRRPHDCARDDGELLVRAIIKADSASLVFDGTLHGHFGDRLFLAIPEQRGVDEALDRAFVLESDLSLRVTVSNRGLLGRKRAVRVKQIQLGDLPRTGTD